MGSPVILDPKLCLLGLLPDVDIDKSIAVFVRETLYMARKTIAKTWMQPTPPTFQTWLREINIALPYKKLICEHRGCPHKT